MKDLVHDKVERKEHGEEKNERKAPGVFSRLKPALAALVITVGACSDEFGATLPPVTNDGGVDGGMGGDGGMDGGMGGDGGMDGGMGGDAGMDGGGGDGGMDAGPAACASVMVAAPWSGIILTGATQTHGGYAFTYVGVSGGGEALFDVGCEGMLRLDDHAFPEDIATTVAIPIDGRSVKVTPHGLNGSQVNVTIEVL